jgi:general secretion pathway protein D
MKKLFKINKLYSMLALLTCLALASCAADSLRRDGLALLDAGQTEAGLAKLEEAAKSEPGELKYRAEFLRKREQATGNILRAADSDRINSQLDAAEVNYRRVQKIEPGNDRAKAGLDAIEAARRHAARLKDAQALAKKGDTDAVQGRLASILAENPTHREALAMQRQMEEQNARGLGNAPVLKTKFKKPVTLQFRDANLKMVFEALSRAGGINILLDRDIRADLKTTIFVKDAALEDTLDLILLQNQLEKKVLNDNSVLVYPVSPAKTRDYQDLKVRSFQLNTADPKQMLTMIKTILKTKDVFVDEKTNSLIMRDTPDAIRLAEKLITAQDQPESEVMLEVEVLEVTRSTLLELGIKYPDQLNLSLSGTAASTTPIISSTGVTTLINNPATDLNLSTLRDAWNGKGGSNVKVAPLSLTLNAKRETGDANILATPRIRVRNREKAKILIGDRVPVITSNPVASIATGTATATNTTATSVQYLDVGLKLDVEPNIYLDDEVGIKVNLEVSNIVKEVSGSSGTLAYQIGTRSVQTVLRLKDGETQVLAGLISDEDRNSAQKIPGLGDLPILGRLFGTNNDNKRKTEIVLSITPRLVRGNKHTDAQNIEFWSGTEAMLKSRPLNLAPDATVSIDGSGGVSTSGTATPGTPPGSPTPRTSPRPPIIPGIAPGVPPALPGAPQPPAVPLPVPPGTPPGPPSGEASPAQRPPPAQPVNISWQGPAQAKLGDTVTLTLNATSPGPVGVLPLAISYDTAVLRVMEVTEGAFFKQQGVQSVFSHNVDANAGRVTVELAQPSDEPLAGNGSVATITFKTIATKPQTQVSVSAWPAPGGKLPPLGLPGPHSFAIVP